MRARDLVPGIRSHIRRPAFAATAVLLLALGAAVNAAVFSVVRSILLRPLPYAQPERLVAVSPQWFLLNEDLAYWRARTRTLQSVSAWSPGWLMALGADGVEPLKVTGARVTDTLFDMLGVRAALGRTIRTGDGAAGRNAVVVLSAALHERHFGGDPGIIGQLVLLDGLPHEVIGVMPAGFEFVEPGTDLWTPSLDDPGSRVQYGLAFGRLRPDATLEQANAEFAHIVAAMREDLGRTEDFGRGVRLIGLHQAVTGDVRPTLLILLATVGLILLLAAVNLGTLVLGRSIERAREMAVRTALGATRWRLAGQLVAEHAVLAAAGALIGVLLARLAMPLLVRRIPPEIPRQGDIALDTGVFVVVIAATVLLSVACALVPVVLAARPDLQPLLRQQQHGETPQRRAVLGSLVAAQVALAIVLGIGAGLMLRTLWHLQRVDPGFDPQGLLTFRLQTTSKRLTLTTGLAYYDQVLERLRALPGVTDVGAIQHLPMTGYDWMASYWRPEAPPAPGAARPSTVWRFVAWDYFRAMRIPLVAGRDFTVADHREAPEVAIINETFARDEFGDAASAIGRRVVTFSSAGEETVEIVGVVRDVRFFSLHEPAAPEMYRPLAQAFMFPMSFVVRTTGDPVALAPAVRQVAYDIDPAIPVAEMQPLTTLISGTVGRPRLLALLLTVFAAAGLTLSVVGVYGVVAYRVRQQRQQLSIRVALGASPERLARAVVAQGAAYALAGLLTGLPAAYALAALMAAVLFGVSPRDPITFTVLPLIVVLTVLVASAVPARRAARVDPMIVIRGE